MACLAMAAAVVFVTTTIVAAADRAFIWDAENGMRDLSQVLRFDYGWTWQIGY